MALNIVISGIDIKKRAKTCSRIKGGGGSRHQAKRNNNDTAICSVAAMEINMLASARRISVKSEKSWRNEKREIETTAGK